MSQPITTLDPMVVVLEHAAKANEDRDAWVDDVFQDALDRAVRHIRAGRYGRGEYELVRAELRVARVLGDAAAVEQLEQIRYFEFGGKS
jgi:hypothetical protein